MRTIGRGEAGGTLGNPVKITTAPQRPSVITGTILAPAPVLAPVHRQPAGPSQTPRPPTWGRGPWSGVS